LGRLDGKVALVTGAAQGIGRGIAGRFAAEGARVAVVDLKRDVGERTVSEIEAAGGTAFFHEADVAEEAQIRGMIAAAVARYGKLDVLVNNAVWTRRGSVTELDPADWNRALNVGCTAVFLGCKHAIPEMIKAGGGSIVTISSPHGVLASANNAAYVTLKAAVINLMRNVAIDYGHQGIRANAILPGLIVHEGNEHRHAADPDRAELNRKLFLSGRVGTPEDIGYAALYLASDESSFITGTALVVDGGLLCQLQDNLVDRMEGHYRERFGAERT
jgi:cyclopentanol dehydrogenase